MCALYQNDSLRKPTWKYQGIEVIQELVYILIISIYNLVIIDCRCWPTLLWSRHPRLSGKNGGDKGSVSLNNLMLRCFEGRDSRKDPVISASLHHWNVNASHRKAFWSIAESATPCPAASQPSLCQVPKHSPSRKHHRGDSLWAESALGKEVSWS